MFRLFTACIAVCTLAAGSALGDPVRWSWSNRDGQGASQNDSAGAVRNVRTSFDSSTNTLNFRVVFTGKSTDGFTLVINDGPGRDVDAGRSAMIYVDGSRNRTRGVRMSAYAYNGKNRLGFRDANAKERGKQSPDRIHGALDTDWINRATLRRAGKNRDRRVFRFSVNLSDVLGHDPLEGDAETWLGAGFSQDAIGMFMETYDGLRTRYRRNGALRRWSARDTGWFETDQDSIYDDDDDRLIGVPMPTGAAMGLLGLSALVLSRRRTRVTR